MGVEPRVKICGVTRLEDAALAADLGAWAVGLIFHRPSPRSCGVERAAEVAAALKRRTEVVGVFVNRPLDEVVDTAEAVGGLTLLQLHGDEGPAYCQEAGRRTGCRVIKAVRARSRADIQGLGPYSVDYHLLDNHAEGRWGGTGETFDWELVSARSSDVPLVVSGGLDPGNVADAIAATQPFAVDVASGVEAEPGVKDPAKLEAFFAAARDGDRDRQPIS